MPKNARERNFTFKEQSREQDDAADNRGEIARNRKTDELLCVNKRTEEILTPCASQRNNRRIVARERRYRGGSRQSMEVSE